MARVGSKLNRPEVLEHDIEVGIERLRLKLKYRLDTKGRGAYASRHEILGIITEEYKELIDAVQLNGEQGNKETKNELLDVAVGAIFGYICMDGGYLEW